MSAELAPLRDEDLRAEARAILDRLPPDALWQATEILRSFEDQTGVSEAEKLNHFFTSLGTELREAIESVRAARAGLNELTAQLAKIHGHH